MSWRTVADIPLVSSLEPRPAPTAPLAADTSAKEEEFGRCKMKLDEAKQRFEEARPPAWSKRVDPCNVTSRFGHGAGSADLGRAPTCSHASAEGSSAG